jgi:hypothetical protein
MNDKELQMNWLMKALNKNRTAIEESLISLLSGILIVAVTILLDIVCYRSHSKLFRVSNFYDVLMYPLLIASVFLFVIVVVINKSLDRNPKFLIFLQKAIVFVGGLLFILGFFRS